MRITRKMLDEQVKLINEISNEKYVLYKEYMGYQLQKNNGRNDTSANWCLTPREMFFHLMGIIHGLTTRK